MILFPRGRFGFTNELTLLFALTALLLASPDAAVAQDPTINWVRWEDAVGNELAGPFDEGTTVYLAVDATGFGTGEVFLADIFEDDVVFNETIAIDVPIPHYSGSKWRGSWAAQWIDDGAGDPEVFFALDTYGDTSGNITIRPAPVIAAGPNQLTFQETVIDPGQALSPLVGDPAPSTGEAQGPAVARANLFHDSRADLKLLPEQTQRRSSLLELATTERLRVVQVDLEALRASSLVLSLFPEKQFSANRRRIEERAEGDFTWFGDISKGSGSVILVVRNGNVTGSIKVGSDSYEIRPLGGGLHAVRQIDRSMYPPDHPPGPDTALGDSLTRSERASPAAQFEAMQSDPGIIRVLVAYTPAARASVGDTTAMEDLIRLAIEETNDSYINSDIEPRLILTQSSEVSYVESGFISTDLARLRERTDGHMDDVHLGRDTSAADVVILLFNDGSFCGEASQILADSATAFAVVYHDCATGDFSFGHEIGHLQGARHNEERDPAVDPFPYGHGLLNTDAGEGWRTIMAYNDAGQCPGGLCPRLQYWSNPDIDHPTTLAPMGTSDTNDNARVLDETADAVGSFRDASSFAVYNDGHADLVITGISKQSSSTWLEINPPPDPIVIPTGKSINIYVSVHASTLSAGTYSDRILVYSNDSDENPYPDGVEVNLTVTGIPEFSDVPDGAWFEPYVDYVGLYGVIEGFPDGTYRPDNPATRAEVLKMAYVAADEDIDNTADPGLADVSPGDWFYPYVADAFAEGFVQGVPCGSQTCFLPDENVTRGEAVKIISEVFRADEQNPGGLANADPYLTFPDAGSGNPFHEYIDWMANAEHTEDDPPPKISSPQRLISGYPNGDFVPGDEVNRAEMAKIVANTMLYCRTGDNAIDCQNPPPPPPSPLKGGGLEPTSIGLEYEQILEPGNFNDPPLVTHPGGYQQVVADPITLTGDSTASDNGVPEDLFYHWTATGGEFATSDPVDFTEVTWTPPQVSVTTVFVVTAIAGDRRGRVSRSVFEFTAIGDGSNTPPAIALTEPDGVDDEANPFYTIRWVASDPDDDATISLFYDVDDAGFDGTLIAGAEDLPEDGSPLYVWDTTGIAADDYYVYARIDDDVNPPQYDYSAGPVTVISGGGSPLDPYNWRLTEHSPGMDHQDIAYGNGVYLAVGTEAVIGNSTNGGLSWGYYGSTNITDDMDFYASHYAGGRWVLVGEDHIGGIIVYTDNPDLSWSIVPHWYGDSLRDVHYAAGKWVAVGEDNLVLYSSDGANWSLGGITGTSYSFEFRAVTYDTAHGKWIAVSESNTNNSQIATSSDGINWQQISFFESGYRLQGLDTAGGLTVAVGYKSFGADREVLLTSSNGGQSWVDRSSGTLGLYDVVHTADGWVAVGEGVATSENGSAWQRGVANLNQVLKAVEYAQPGGQGEMLAVRHSQIHKARPLGSSIHYLIEISVYGSGNVSGAGLNCANYCLDSWGEGNLLPFTAMPASGWLFDGWDGDCDGTSGCQVVMTENKSVIADFSINDPPTIAILDPDGVFDKAYQSYTIIWDDTDPDSNASVRLFYDLDAGGADGTLITQSAIQENDETDQYQWDTSALPEDDYYIYAQIDDGVNPPMVAYGSGPITIIHNVPPELILVEPDGVNDTEDLSYTITWTDEDPDDEATIDLYYDTDASGADGILIQAGLSEGDETDSFVWDISGLPEESFYVYGIIDDGVMDPVTAYSPGPLTVLHVSTNVPPTIDVTEPDGVSDVADLTYTITWTDEDPDNDAAITLFYDDDGAGADGTAIHPAAISEDDETDSYVWDTSNLAEGDYYVYAVIDDGVRPPMTSYSSGPVTVSHANAVPALVLQEPDGMNDHADQNYVVTWGDDDGDDDAAVSLYYDDDNVGFDGFLIQDGLSEDDPTNTHVWKTTGVKGGDYYLYAEIDDGNHTPTMGYSPGQVSIDHPGYAFEWVRSAGTTLRDRGYGVDTDSGDNSYITGRFRDDIQFGSTTIVHVDNRDSFLAKFDPAGNVIWAQGFVGEDDIYGTAVAVDGSDNVCVTGYFETEVKFGSTTLSAVGNTDMYLAKLDSSGSLLWAQRYGVSGWTEALAVDGDGSGNCYVTGSFTGQVTFGGTTFTSPGRADIFVLKVNNGGQVVWARQAGGQVSEPNEGKDIAVDDNGNVYVTGAYFETATFGTLSITALGYNSDIFVVKYNSSGTPVWLRSAGGTRYDHAEGIAVDSGGGVYVTGVIDGDADFDHLSIIIDGVRNNMFIAHYASNGIVQWVNHGGHDGFARGYDIAVTSDQTALVTGRFVYSLSSAKFDEITLDGAGSYLAQYAFDGTLDWVRPVAFGTFSQGNGVALDGEENVLNTGYIYGDNEFDRIAISSVGDSDVYLAKIDRTGPANATPTLQVTEPDGVGDVVADVFSITWVDENLEEDARILLYYDSDAGGEDGTLITPTALSEDDEGDQYGWDVSAMAAGSYYVYALISDGVNPVVTAYSPGPLTVDPSAGNVAPTLAILEPNGTGDSADRTFDVIWTDEDPDDDASIALYYDTDNSDADGTLIVEGLSENDETDRYVWDTSAMIAGDYYVYAVVTDGLNAPLVAYSTGPVTISHCAPPAAGDWIVTESCTFESSASAPNHVVVAAPAVLTLGAGAVLNVAGDVTVEPGAMIVVNAAGVLQLDLLNHKLLVQEDSVSGVQGGVLIKLGGVIRQAPAAP